MNAGKQDKTQVGGRSAVAVQRKGACPSNLTDQWWHGQGQAAAKPSIGHAM